MQKSKNCWKNTLNCIILSFFIDILACQAFSQQAEREIKKLKQVINVIKKEKGHSQYKTSKKTK